MHQAQVVAHQVLDAFPHRPAAAQALADGDGAAVVGSTRPELLPACVALVVNPDDTRYADLVDMSDDEESEMTVAVKKLLSDSLQRADESPQPDPATPIPRSNMNS